MPAGTPCVCLVGADDWYLGFEPSDPADERDVLVRLYEACGGDQWTDNSRWLEEGPYPDGQVVRDATSNDDSAWFGVSPWPSGKKRGALKRLELLFNGLSCRTLDAPGTKCLNVCEGGKYRFDGFCQDGGDGSEYSLCTIGTDCGDCTATRIEPRFLAVSHHLFLSIRLC